MKNEESEIENGFSKAASKISVRKKILHSKFFILHSKFFILNSSFFIK